MSDVQVERPLRADARRNRQRILAAALEEYALAGGDAQVDAIAARAGVGVGTLYRHFPTKDVLVAELVRDRFEGFVERAREALGHEDPWEAFAWLMRENARECAADPGTQHVFMAGDPSLGPRLARETGLYDLSQQLIDRGQAAGVIREDFCAHDIGMLMCGVAAATARPVPGWDWERHLGFLLDGLRAR